MSMSKKVFLILVAIFAAGLFLRTLYLGKSAITFEYDQARDLFTVGQLVSGDVKIQGPSANAPGLYHGVFYYYFLAIPYLLSAGNPVVATFWLALISSATVFVVYILSYKLTANRAASVLASLFFAFSFKASQYATKLSNPSPALWFVPLTYLFLWLWTKRRKSVYAALSGVFWGLSIQSDIFLVYHGVAIFIWLVINKRNLIRRHLAYFFGALILSISTILISEIKFGFQGLKGITYLFSGADTIISGKGSGDFIVIYLNQLGSTFAQNLFPIGLGFGGFVGIILFVWFAASYFTKRKNGWADWKLFLLVYILSHLPVIFWGGLTSAYLTVGIDVAVIVLVAYSVTMVWERTKIIALAIILVIIVSNLIKIVGENKKGQTLFAIRNEMLLSNLEDVVDYTYESSKKEQFSINTVTAPFWTNTTWSYIYSWYGLKKYGMLPYWHGRSQEGILGNNLLPTPTNITTYFLIIEPRVNVSGALLANAVGEEDSVSKIVEEKDFGGIIVQRRVALK